MTYEDHVWIVTSSENNHFKMILYHQKVQVILGIKFLLFFDNPEKLS